MNFYDVLGAARDARPDELRQAYRERARRLHPDVNDHPRARDQFRVLDRARDVLVDEAERAAYDRLGHAEYVEKRIDGDFPETDVVPEPSGRVGGDEASHGTDDSAPEDEPPRGDADTPGQTRTRSRGETPSGDDGTSDANAAAHSTPPTPGGDGATGGSRSRGPQRVRDEPTADAWRQRPLGENLKDHLAVSTRWLGVVATVAAYAGGLVGFLGSHRTGVNALADALTSSDPVAVAGALRDERYGVPSVTAYAADGGFVAGVLPSDGVLLVGGAVFLPVSVALAVAGLRRATTWRPTWLYVAGTLGPTVAVALGHVASNRPEGLPVSSVPLLADLLLLVGFPAVAVVVFLTNRLVVVWPLLRREDLGVP